MSCVSKKKIEDIEMILASVPPLLVNLSCDEFHMIKLTKDNSVFIETQIKADPRYNSSRGFAAYEKITKSGVTIKNASYEQIRKVIKGISSDNNTRSSDLAINALTSYIDKNRESFFVDLEKGEIGIFNRLVNSFSSRKEKSLSSKICRYFEEWIYESTHYNYAIYDSVLKNALPYYWVYYGITSDWKSNNIDKIQYPVYVDLIKKLKDAVELADSEILNIYEIDHIIWYGYKSDSIRSAILPYLAKSI